MKVIMILFILLFQNSWAAKDFDDHVSSLNNRRSATALARQQEHRQKAAIDQVHELQNRLVRSCIGSEHFVDYDRRTLTIRDSDGCLVMYERRIIKKTCASWRRCQRVSKSDAISLLESAVIGSNADIGACLKFFSGSGYPVKVRPESISYDPASILNGSSLD